MKITELKIFLHIAIEVRENRKTARHIAQKLSLFCLYLSRFARLSKAIKQYVSHDDVINKSFYHIII